MNLILLFAVLHHASLKMCHIQIVICEQILDLTPQEAKLNQYYIQIISTDHGTWISM